MSIKISEVLKKVQASGKEGEVFSLNYVNSKGELRVYKQMKRAHRADKKGSSDNQFRYNTKHKGVLLLIDMDAKMDRSLKIRQITHFNGLVVEHGQ